MQKRRGHFPQNYARERWFLGWIFLAAAAWPQSWSSVPLPGEGGLRDTVATWDDSVLAESSTTRLALRSSPASSRRTFSFSGPAGPSVSVLAQRSEPGGVRRRSLLFSRDSFSVRAGDLPAWTEDPLLEGSGRSGGYAAPSEASGWRMGSGYYPNGIDASGREETWSARGRWRSDRAGKGRTQGAGAVHLGTGPFHLGARSEDGPLRSVRVASLGADLWRCRLRLASTAKGDPAAWAGVDSSDGNWRLSGSARWVSGGFRHGGLSGSWPGSSALDAAASLGMPEGVGASVRTQLLDDSTGKKELRQKLQLRGRPVFGIQLRAEGLVDRASDRAWESARIGLGGFRGSVRPWLEQSWSDSGADFALSTSVGLRWMSKGRTLRAEGIWRWGVGPGFSIAHEGHVTAGAWDLGFRLEGSGTVAVQTVLRGQGALTCAW